jgi:hypothetical protein
MSDLSDLESISLLLPSYSLCCSEIPNGTPNGFELMLPGGSGQTPPGFHTIQKASRLSCGELLKVPTYPLNLEHRWTKLEISQQAGTAQ